MIPADTGWERKYSFCPTSGSAARKYRALPNAGLSQPKIIAIHVFIKLPLEKLTRKNSHRTAQGDLLLVPQRLLVPALKSLSPWTVTEEQKHCNGSMALFHPPLYNAMQWDKGRRAALTYYRSTTHCCLASMSGPMAETFLSRSLGPLTAFCC